VTFISYAQNFEDLTLWRALKLFGPGCYIDIGANHPTLDSVTHTLYERGWRGVNIEPVLHYHQALCAERPEDINLCEAVGEREAELLFFESSATGLSTLSLETATQQREMGISFVERVVKVRTLSSICEEHLRSELPLQFLKIDVEGFEEQVLRGMDFRRWRPWIILIESSYHTDPAWKHLILDAGYRFALCDGINRYYVAEEKTCLLEPLALPPNLIDDFRLCPGHRFSHPPEDTAVLHSQLHKATARAERAEGQLTAIYGSRLWALVRGLAWIRRRLFGK
jgi:FkbM family methyltransferase